MHRRLAAGLLIGVSDAAASAQRDNDPAAAYTANIPDNLIAQPDGTVTTVRRRPSRSSSQLR